jgi:Ca2+/H+ antiporter, TMEM165/GDT1 family
MRKHWPIILLKILVAVAIFIAVFGQIVLRLWNWLMPSLFGLHPITFWQALGLLALSWILFGGMRGFHRGRRPGYGRWRHRMRERWEQMTPEERERFRQGMRSRCGGFGIPEPQPKS